MTHPESKNESVNHNMGDVPAIGIDSMVIGKKKRVGSQLVGAVQQLALPAPGQGQKTENG